MRGLRAFPLFLHVQNHTLVASRAKMQWAKAAFGGSVLAGSSVLLACAAEPSDAQQETQVEEVVVIVTKPVRRARELASVWLRLVGRWIETLVLSSGMVVMSLLIGTIPAFAVAGALDLLKDLTSPRGSLVKTWILGLSIVDEEHPERHATVTQRIIRNACSPLMIMFLGFVVPVINPVLVICSTVNFFPALLTDKRQTICDRLAGTIVVRESTRVYV